MTRCFTHVVLAIGVSPMFVDRHGVSPMFACGLTRCFTHTTIGVSPKK